MSASQQVLLARFDEAMMNVYRRALSECGYNASRFLKMLCDHGGMQTAKMLLHAPGVSEGYTALWERHRLDLTVEAVILAPEWRPLFSEREREIAQARLDDYGYSSGT